MTQKQKNEVADFLLYLRLSLDNYTDVLDANGCMTLFDLSHRYPRFKDVRKETVKILKWLKEETK